MKQRIVNLLTAVTLMAALAADGAFAQLNIPIPPGYDAKAYPGSACQPYYGTQAHHFMTFQNGIAPRLLRNQSDPSPDALWVTCPIVRDNSINLDGTWRWESGTGVDVFVDVPAESNPTLLSCHLFSYDMLSGNLMDSHENKNPTEFQPGRFVLGLDVDRSSNVGNYMMSCYLPWKSTLRAYIVREYQSTDENS